MDAIKSDVGLQEQLKEAVDADGVVAIAKAAGFVISAEELKRAQSELSEEELDGEVRLGRVVTHTEAAIGGPSAGQVCVVIRMV